MAVCLEKREMQHVFEWCNKHVLSVASQKRSFRECRRADGKPSTWERDVAKLGHWRIALIVVCGVQSAVQLIPPSKWRPPRDGSASWTSTSQLQFLPLRLKPNMLIIVFHCAYETELIMNSLNSLSCVPTCCPISEVAEQCCCILDTKDLCGFRMLILLKQHRWGSRRLEASQPRQPQETETRENPKSSLVGPSAKHINMYNM